LGSVKAFSFNALFSSLVFLAAAKVFWWSVRGFLVFLFGFGLALVPRLALLLALLLTCFVLGFALGFALDFALGFDFGFALAFSLVLGFVVEGPASLLVDVDPVGFAATLGFLVDVVLPV